MTIGPDKERCGAQRPGQPEGVTCKQPAGARTDHLGVGRCWRHGGNTQSQRKNAELELARRECATLGIKVETSPAEALMEELWEACGNVEFYRALVQQLPTHPEPDAYFPPSGDEETKGYWERGEAGVYGRVYHVSGVPTGEAKPHVLVQLYNEERRRKAEIAAAALRAGVDERRLQIAEADASKILGAQVQALIALGMGDRLEEFRVAFTDALRAVIEQPASLGAAAAI